VTESLPYAAADVAAVRPDEVAFVAELCADLAALARHLANVIPSTNSDAPLSVVDEDEPECP
jgi:hypothetical protein